jgi:predicted HTH transcriptional regulator
VHRQYLNSAENIITITDKEVVIYSPGTFMGNTKPNDYLFGEGISRRRNEILANALKFCGYIEKFGTGIKRTYDICKERGIDFNIKTDNYGVFVSFSRNNFLDNKSKNQKNVDDLDELKNITPNNWKILLLLIKHKELKIREISNKIKLSVMQTNRYINKLIEEKLIIKNNQYCSLGLLKEKILFHALLTIGFDDINDINYNITTIKKE